MLKWIAGILASITAGVGVWLVTDVLLPVREDPPVLPPEADSRSVGNLLTEARLSRPSSDGTHKLIGTFEVLNEGGKTLENCRITFDGRRGDRFSLAPGDSHEEMIRGGNDYRGPSIVAVQATLECASFRKILSGGKITIGRPDQVAAPRNSQASPAGPTVARPGFSALETGTGN